MVQYDERSSHKRIHTSFRNNVYVQYTNIPTYIFIFNLHKIETM